jgi:hypothetical protein
LRRAAGLALIAAAAAASPAANISRLIAAFASLSRVSFPEVDPPFRLDFAIANLPLVLAAKDTSNAERFRFGDEQSRALPGFPSCKYVKGDRCPSNDPLEHGQRPEVLAVRSALTADEHPFPTSLLNHETSDHLLSLR